MPTEIVIIRHGQSEGNRDRVFTGHGPSSLTSLGQRQAEAAARAVLVSPVDHIYSSDLPRALQTAAPLARESGLTIEPAAAIRERDVGAWTGLSFDEIMTADPSGWRALLSRDAGYQPPGGESHRDCRRRVGAFLDEILRRHVDERVALVSHGVAINHLLRHALAVDSDDASAYFAVDNCSLQRLTYRNAERFFQVHTVNDTAHLGDLLVDEG